MKRSKKRLLIISSLLAVPLVAAAIAFPIFARARENARKSSCRTNLKHIALILALYAKDFDDRLPPVALHSADEVHRVRTANRKAWETGGNQVPGSPFGWCDALYPYAKSTSIYQCPCEVSDSTDSPTQRGYTDYWLNTHVAGKKRAGLNAATIFMIGDGNGHEQSNARYSKSALPANLAEDRSDDLHWQPAWPLRHLGGANYTFVDGHIKWLKPEAVSTAPGAAYTFAPH